MHKKFLVKWLLIILLLAASSYMSLKTSFASFVFLFWLLLSILTVSLLWLTLVYFGTRIHLERKITLKIEEEDFLDITLEIKNKGIFPAFGVVLRDYLSCARKNEREKFILLDSLGFAPAAKVTYRSFCPQRGKYNIGPLSAYFFDPFGIFYFKKTFPVYSELYVYPRTFKIRKFPVLAKGTVPWFGIETTHTSGDEDEFYGVREYKKGDPLKRIDWMASARKNQLITKVFQRQNFFRVTILFNLAKEGNFGEGKESVAEYTIKIVASIAKYLTGLDVSIAVMSHIGEVVYMPFNKGAEHLEDILKFLTVAQPESRVTLLEVFETFYRELSEDSSLIIVMTDKDRDYLPAMLSFGFINISTIPIILISSTFLKNYGAPENIKDYLIDISGAVKLNPIYIARQDNLEEKF